MRQTIEIKVRLREKTFRRVGIDIRRFLNLLRFKKLTQYSKHDIIMIAGEQNTLDCSRFGPETLDYHSITLPFGHTGIYMLSFSK